jgi:hypothetical protein
VSIALRTGVVDLYSVGNTAAYTGIAEGPALTRHHFILAPVYLYDEE